ncbi:MAG TPA: hypothetical protein VFE58_02735 [Tepidisphaeraceae bacterium]|jgi:hypothetical protein|nr:hypothetical protein [Tepidisphaeraceae bacterium]
MNQFATQILDQTILLADREGSLEECQLRGGHLIDRSKSPRVGMEARNPKLGVQYYEDFDLFRCLALFRQEIEPNGWRVLCNAARLNAWQSGMSSQMSAGMKIYLLRSKQEGGSVLVDAFEKAPLSEVVTFDRQEAWVKDFHKRQSDVQK